jgi:TRAP-type mannitol/chloroaromatic compound transport system substrate-binding protein
MKKDYPKIQVKTFPLPVLKAMKKATDEILNENAAKDASFKEVLDSQRAYMKKARVYTKISEFDYIKTANEVGE